MSLFICLVIQINIDDVLCDRQRKTERVIRIIIFDRVMREDVLNIKHFSRHPKAVNEGATWFLEGKGSMQKEWWVQRVWGRVCLVSFRNRRGWYDGSIGSEYSEGDNWVALGSGRMGDEADTQDRDLF